jgi:hypothetical protein
MRLAGRIFVHHDLVQVALANLGTFAEAGSLAISGSQGADVG